MCNSMTVTGAVQAVISLAASLAATTAAVAAVAVVASFATDVVHGATVVHIRITRSCSNSIYIPVWQRLSRTYQ
jgi:hypothetical protein